MSHSNPRLNPPNLQADCRTCSVEVAPNLIYNRINSANQEVARANSYRSCSSSRLQVAEPSTPSRPTATCGPISARATKRTHFRTPVCGRRPASGAAAVSSRHKAPLRNKPILWCRRPVSKPPLRNKPILWCRLVPPQSPITKQTHFRQGQACLAASPSRVFHRGAEARFTRTQANPVDGVPSR